LRKWNEETQSVGEDAPFASARDVDNTGDKDSVINKLNSQELNKKATWPQDVGGET